MRRLSTCCLFSPLCPLAVGHGPEGGSYVGLKLVVRVLGNPPNSLCLLFSPKLPSLGFTFFKGLMTLEPDLGKPLYDSAFHCCDTTFEEERLLGSRLWSSKFLPTLPCCFGVVVRQKAMVGILWYSTMLTFWGPESREREEGPGVPRST